MTNRMVRETADALELVAADPVGPRAGADRRRSELLPRRRSPGGAPRCGRRRTARPRAVPGAGAAARDACGHDCRRQRRVCRCRPGLGRRVRPAHSATRSAKFNTAFLDVAVAGDMGLPWSLPRLLGAGKARELCMLPGKFDAAEAQRIGFLARVFDDEDFASQADDVVRRLATQRACGAAHHEGQLPRRRTARPRRPFIELESQRHLGLFTLDRHPRGLRRQGRRPATPFHRPLSPVSTGEPSCSDSARSPSSPTTSMPSSAQLHVRPRRRRSPSTTRAWPRSVCTTRCCRSATSSSRSSPPSATAPPAAATSNGAAGTAATW